MSTSVDFEPATHMYSVNGKRVPGVTEILQAVGLGADLTYVDSATRLRTAALGTLVHTHAAALLRGELPSCFDFAPEYAVASGYLLAVRHFVAETGFTAQGIEQPLYSARYNYCGTPDAWGVTSAGNLVILDLKTGRGRAPSWALQLVAYDLLLVEQTCRDPQLPTYRPRLVLQLRADGTYKVSDAYDPLAHQVWLAALIESRGAGTPVTAALLSQWRAKHYGH